MSDGIDAKDEERVIVFEKKLLRLKDDAAELVNDFAQPTLVKMLENNKLKKDMLEYIQGGGCQAEKLAKQTRRMSALQHVKLQRNYKRWL